MTDITITLTDEAAASLAAEARRRGYASPADLLADVAADVAAAANEEPDPPPEVLAEVRRRQEAPLSGCRPVGEVVADLLAKIDRIEAEQQREARQKSA